MAGALGAALGVAALKLGRMTPELLRKAVARYRKHQKAMAKNNQLIQKQFIKKQPPEGRAFLKDTETGYAVNTGKDQVVLGGKPVLVDNPLAVAKEREQVANALSNTPKKAINFQKKKGRKPGANMQKLEKTQQALTLNQPVATNEFATPNNDEGNVMGYSVKQPDKPKVVNPGIKPVVNAPISSKKKSKQKKSKQEYDIVHSDFFGS